MADKFLNRIQRKYIQTRVTNGYQVFDITRDLGLGADFGELNALIQNALDSGSTNIAIRFTPDSYLYTSTLAGLVNFFKMVQEKQGMLCLISPNEGILEVLDAMGLREEVQIVPSEKEVGKA